MVNVYDNLWCVGGKDSTKISWTLPNGEILHESKSKSLFTSIAVKAVYTIKGHVLVLLLGSDMLPGVYTCRVEDRVIDGTINEQHAWINSGSMIIK